MANSDQFTAYGPEFDRSGFQRAAFSTQGQDAFDAAYAGTSAVRPEPLAQAKAQHDTELRAGLSGKSPGRTSDVIQRTNVTQLFKHQERVRAIGVTHWVIAVFEFGHVFATDCISCSISELNNNGEPFRGLASVRVEGVVPTTEGNIEVTFVVDWGEPLNVLLSFIIVR